LRILLLRHGKSDWEAPYDGDHDRPLAPRGQSAAAAIGRFLSEAGRAPDRILSSTARRARDTVVIAAQSGRWAAPIVTTDALYGAGAGEALAAARRHMASEQERVGCLLLAGHEPTFSELTGRLIGRGRIGFPTAAVASIRFAGEDWDRVDFGAGELEFLVKPKILGRYLPEQ